MNTKKREIFSAEFVDPSIEDSNNNEILDPPSKPAKQKKKTVVTENKDVTTIPREFVNSFNF